MDTSIMVAIIAATATVTTSVIGLIGLYISRRKDHEGKNEGKVTIDFKGRNYLQEPSEILAEKKNRLKIESDFLLWQQCTILIWIYVPPKGEGLRNSPDNRYIISHHTGEKDVANYLYYNQFVFRHTSHRERWEIQFSDSKASYPDSALGIGDGLDTGWHQFMIAWDNEKNKLIFVIDKGKGGTELTTSYRPFWPTKLHEKVTVGAWTSDYWAGHYCQTKLYQLWILDRFLDPSDSIVSEHFKIKPRP